LKVVCETTKIIIMSDPKGHKLSRLLSQVPEGLLVDAAWLERHGYPIALRSRYVDSGWLQSLTHGVYRRPPPTLRPTAPEDLPWTLVVVSLQTLLGWPGVVGGRTALELQGLGHFLKPGREAEVHLHGDTAPPRWVNRLPIATRFRHHRDGRLFPLDKRGSGLGAVAVDVASGVTTPLPEGAKGGPPASPWSATSWPLTCSSPERAILEWLDELPARETFQQVDLVFQSLANLNPRRMQRLLEACGSIKVKRLFLWFATRHRLRLLDHLDRDRIDLGAGKRLIARNGRLDPEFEITVPGDLDAAG
jgi:hypothetical protein